VHAAGLRRSLPPPFAQPGPSRSVQVCGRLGGGEEAGPGRAVLCQRRHVPRRVGVGSREWTRRGARCPTPHHAVCSLHVGAPRRALHVRSAPGCTVLSLCWLHVRSALAAAALSTLHCTSALRLDACSALRRE
jgi:hypothetical protein